MSASPVTSSSIPGWLRLLWVRNLPIDLPRSKRKYINRLEARRQMESWLDSVAAKETRHRFHAFDHYGTSMIDGKQCFVTEPYETLKDALAYFRPLGNLLGIRITGSNETFHNHECSWIVRVVLHPPDAH